MAPRREIRWVRIKMTRFGMTNESDRPLKWFDKKYVTLKEKVEALRTKEVVALDPYRQPMDEREAINLLYASAGSLQDPDLPPTGKLDVRNKGTLAEPKKAPEEGENEKLRKELEDLKQVVGALSGQEELTPDFIQSLSRSLRMSKEHNELSQARQVFIAYFRDDEEDVRRLREAILDAGYDVWWDEDLLAGDDWELSVREAMTDSEVLLVVLSRRGLEQDRSAMHVDVETALAIYLDLEPKSQLLIPVRLSECVVPSIPIGDNRSLASLRTIDLFPESYWETGVKRLLSGIAHRRRSRGSTGASSRTS